MANQKPACHLAGQRVAIVLLVFNIHFIFPLQGAGKLILDDARKPGGDKSWCQTSGCQDISTSKAGWISVAVAAGAAILGSVVLVPLLKRRAKRQIDTLNRQAGAWD